MLRTEGLHIRIRGAGVDGGAARRHRTGRARAICCRLRTRCERRGGDRLDVARFLLRAGDTAATVDTAARGAGARIALGSPCPRDYAAILRAAVDVCAALRRSPRDRFMLLRSWCASAITWRSPASLVAFASCIGQLRRESGLNDWEQLDPDSTSPRLQRAIDAAQGRHDAAPEHERGLAPIEAIIALGRLVSDTIASPRRSATTVCSAGCRRSSHSLRFSPGIERLQTLSVPASKAGGRGALREGDRGLYDQSLRLRSEVPGIRGGLRQWAICALHYATGSIEAGPRPQSSAAACGGAGDRGRLGGAGVDRSPQLLPDHRQFAGSRALSQPNRALMFAERGQAAARGRRRSSTRVCILDGRQLTGMRRAIDEMEAIARVAPDFSVRMCRSRAPNSHGCAESMKKL